MPRNKKKMHTFAINWVFKPVIPPCFKERITRKICSLDTESDVQPRKSLCSITSWPKSYALQRVDNVLNYRIQHNYCACQTSDIKHNVYFVTLYRIHVILVFPHSSHDKTTNGDSWLCPVMPFSFEGLDELINPIPDGSQWETASNFQHTFLHTAAITTHHFNEGWMTDWGMIRRLQALCGLPPLNTTRSEIFK